MKHFKEAAIFSQHAGTHTRNTRLAARATTATTMARALKHTVEYLPFQAMAETTRMIFAHGRVPHENLVVWGRAFRREAYPFGKVPCLHVAADGATTTVAQSGAIARYAAKLAGVCRPRRRRARRRASRRRGRPGPCPGPRSAAPSARRRAASTPRGGRATPPRRSGSRACRAASCRRWAANRLCRPTISCELAAVMQLVCSAEIHKFTSSIEIVVDGSSLVGPSRRAPRGLRAPPIYPTARGRPRR